MTARTVEGIWQGLKVFEQEPADLTLMKWTGTGPVKRTSRARGRTGVVRGRVLGHQWGPGGALLGYIEARERIYVPAYTWVLTNRAQDELDKLRQLAMNSPVVLLDFATNGDILDSSRPLSHAALIRAHLLTVPRLDPVGVDE
jgi:hypothetical protein